MNDTSPVASLAPTLTNPPLAGHPLPRCGRGAGIGKGFLYDCYAFVLGSCGAPTFVGEPDVNINHITLAVTDLSRSFDFYRDVIGLKPLCRWRGGAYFLAGDIWFCLNLDPNRLAIPGPCYTHYAFSVEAADFAAKVQQIQAAGGIVFKDNKSEGDSLYFLDPDGHRLEIHVGDWQTRLAHKKKDPGGWQDAEFFV
jgi:glutathione S-transferase fosA5